MLTPSLHIPILWGAGLLDQKLPGVFQFFQGVYLSLSSRKWERRRSAAPGTQPAAPAALQLKAALPFLAETLLCAAPERANYGKISNLACMERLLLARTGNTKSFSRGTGEHRDYVLRGKGWKFWGLIHLRVSWKHHTSSGTPPLLFRSLFEPKILFHTKM